MHFVIPGLTRNPVLFWIPAFAGMTPSAVINDAVYTFEFLMYSGCDKLVLRMLDGKDRTVGVMYHFFSYASNEYVG